MCFDNIIYLLANDLYTLEEVSRLCGDTGRGPLISIEELKTMDYFNEIILMPRMMPIKTKVKPDYEMKWDMDKTIIDVSKLSKEKANIFNLK